MKTEDMIIGNMQDSWKLFRKQFVALILGTIIALIGMILIVTIPPLIFGIYYMCTQAAAGKTVQVKDIFKGFDYFFRSWWMMILAILAIIGGLILLVIPGLLLMVVYQFAIPIAITKGKTAYQSLKESYKLGKNNLGFSIILFILLAVINAVGGLTRVGILITVPFTALCVSVAAKKLKA